MSRELDILSKALKNLSKDELDELLDNISEENKEITKQTKKRGRPKKASTQQKPNNGNINYDEIEEDPRIVKASKLLNKNKKQQKSSYARKETKMVEVQCVRCGKPWDLPENYPCINTFVCCV